ncbi:reverse transcriptase domain-containing protein [Candidatus Parabeggiatoa sp. HSG14]|uniref:reverse transcriptase domain-containing protein n=1 Tax=Candidatus Parabeggiatoa sp. HSG14 TaxID=3055593 RepID=UPI0025A7C7E9|nr:reverse transcriptase domain-containing protein [Thiotrichales bacterium HSG14]
MNTKPISPGIEDAIAHLSQLGEALLHNRYKISLLREQSVQNADGSMRLLQVPPFFDRVMQRAVAQVITPSLDTLMYSGSFEFRRGRSRHSAAKMIQKAYQEGYRWVFESDVENFFDSIQWSKLFTRLIAFFGDDLVSDIIMAWMSAPIERQGQKVEQREIGLPQGSPLSPLLANIMLDDFDSDLEHAGLRLVRFADDFIVLTRTEKAAEAAKDVVIAALAEEDLKINESKTRIRSFAQGFRVVLHIVVVNLLKC